MAAESLAGLGARSAVRPLIGALRDTNVEVRFWAAFALGQLGDEAALPDLERAAREDHTVLPGWWSVSQEAMSAIANIRGAPADS